jgi:phosphoglycerate dehydrogenase-like enzyme
MAGAEAPQVVLRHALPPDAMARLAAAWPDARFAVCEGDAGLADRIAGAEVLIGGVELSPETAACAPRLRWVQTASVGVEGFLDLAAQRPDLVVTNSRGVNTTPLAEHALMLMLSFARGMPDLADRQARREWRTPSWSTIPKVFELEGTRLGLVGYGEIGRAIAGRARAFGMEVWALRRRAGPGDQGAADRVLGPDGLRELAAAADHLMAILPLTNETRAMIDAAVFAAMKPSAYFYNLGRGAVADHGALISALAAGRIAGAGLEVVDPEPLPRDSPLWAMPNVIITGHTAGYTPRLLDRTVDFLVEQLGRYRRGEPLANRVRPEAGY